MLAERSGKVLQRVVQPCLRGTSGIQICLNFFPIPGKRIELLFNCTSQLLAKGHSEGRQVPRTSDCLYVWQSCPAPSGEFFQERRYDHQKPKHMEACRILNNGKGDVRGQSELTPHILLISLVILESLIFLTVTTSSNFLPPLKSHSHSCLPTVAGF